MSLYQGTAAPHSRGGRERRKHCSHHGGSSATPRRGDGSSVFENKWLSEITVTPAELGLNRKPALTIFRLLCIVILVPHCLLPQQLEADTMSTPKRASPDNVASYDPAGQEDVKLESVKKRIKTEEDPPVLPDASAAAAVLPPIAAVKEEGHYVKEERTLQANVAPLPVGPGPFPPDTPHAKVDERLLQCHHCHWFSRGIHQDQSPFATNVASEEWCHACGRIAHADTTIKPKRSSFPSGRSLTVRFQPKDHHVLLGHKIIPFHLHVHDPRTMKKYQQRWKENEGNEGWIYDEKQMKAELFRHRYRDNHSLKTILSSVPCVSTELLTEDRMSRLKVPDFHRRSQDELDAIIFPDLNHFYLLATLHQISTSSLISPNHTIEAQWDTEASVGTLHIRVYVDQWTRSTTESAIPLFLAAWMNVLPMSVEALAGHMPASPSAISCSLDKHLIEPFSLERLKAIRSQDIHAQVSTLGQEMARKHEESYKTHNSSLALTTSDPSRPLPGGTCSTDQSTEAVLTAFFRELFCSMSMAISESDSVALMESIVGRVLRHRCTHSLRSYYDASGLKHLSMVDVLIQEPRERSFAAAAFQKAQVAVSKGTASLEGFLIHLENRSHALAPHVDGLKVDLLPFQSQILQWAVDRETMEGGIQRQWCIEVSGEDGEKPLFYNLVTGKFGFEVPKVVRGGIIASQMGLGKTVVSLALILSNPAPKYPSSGLRVASFKDDEQSAPQAEARPGWSKAPQSSDENLFSRGTLVVVRVDNALGP